MSSERGSVSILVAAAVAMTLILVMGVADVARALIARSRAEAVADLAALAATQELALPSGYDPAVVAAEYAERNGADLVACACPEGSLEAVVTVAVHVDGFLLSFAGRDVIARSRAIVDVPT